MSNTIPALFHVREESLLPGQLIAPGRWGTKVLAAGSSHPSYDRELIGEQRRILVPHVQVSRFACTYAFDDLDYAQSVYRGRADDLFLVTPTDPAAPHFRGDMLWLTWMSEEGSTPAENVSRWDAYWRGDPTSSVAPHARTTWEWLFACPLQVVAVL